MINRFMLDGDFWMALIRKIKSCKIQNQHYQRTLLISQISQTSINQYNNQMGTCAGFRACDACNLSEYNQTLEFKILVSNVDHPISLHDSISIDGKMPDDSKSWWRFTKLLESDKSWETISKEQDKLT